MTTFYCFYAMEYIHYAVDSFISDDLLEVKKYIKEYMDEDDYEKIDDDNLEETMEEAISIHNGYGSKYSILITVVDTEKMKTHLFN